MSVEKRDWRFSNMIKIGEMQVNRNINPKTFLFLIIILSCTFLVISTYLVIQFKNIKEYKKLEATIIDVYTERSRGTRDSSALLYLQNMILLIIVDYSHILDY